VCGAQSCEWLNGTITQEILMTATTARKILRCGWVAATALMCCAVSHGQSVIEGRVLLPAPEAATTPRPRYTGQVGEIGPADPPSAVVYLEGQFPPAATNSTPPTAELWQREMQFHPSLLPVRVGTPVAFPNGDEFYHNVFSYSKPKRFDLGRYRNDEKPPPIKVFDKPGVVKLYCEIHQHMRGVILVLDTPYFTRTATNGAYLLENLPAGRYQLKAWADDRRLSTKAVELTAGQTNRVDFDLRQAAR
jgi:plastocyanin